MLCILFVSLIVVLEYSHLISLQHLKNVGTTEFGRVRPSVCPSSVPASCLRGTLNDFLHVG